MKSPRALLAVATAAAVAALASGRAITFTGNVTRDFPTPAFDILLTDSSDTFPNWGFENPSGVINTRQSGMNVYDVRFSYDAATDIAYFGKALWVGGVGQGGWDHGVGLVERACETSL